MLGMLWLPDCDGTRHVFPYEYARVAAVERLSKEPDLRRPDQPHPDLDEVRLAMWPRTGPLLDRLAGRFFARASRLARRPAVQRSRDGRETAGRPGSTATWSVRRTAGEVSSFWIIDQLHLQRAQYGQLENVGTSRLILTPPWSAR
jgi:hypothetical protein